MQDAHTTREAIGPQPGRWSLAVSGIAIVCFVALLALAWLSASTLFLIFAGILLAVFLDGLTRILGSVLALRRGLRLGVVTLGLGGLCVGLVGYGGAMVVQQTRDLGQTVQEQSGTVRDWLKSYGIDSPALEGLGTQKPDTTPKEPPKPQADEDATSQNAPAAEGPASNEGKPSGDRKPQSETAAGASIPSASSILGLNRAGFPGGS